MKHVPAAGLKLTKLKDGVPNVSNPQFTLSKCHKTGCVRWVISSQQTASSVWLPMPSSFRLALRRKVCQVCHGSRLWHHKCADPFWRLRGRSTMLLNMVNMVKLDQINSNYIHESICWLSPLLVAKNTWTMQLFYFWHNEMPPGNLCHQRASPMHCTWLGSPSSSMILLSYSWFMLIDRIG
jgi:hypothetical protein